MLKTNVSFKLNTSGLKKLERQLNLLAKKEIRAGVFDNNLHYSGLSFVELMAIHHTGFTTDTGVRVPARPVLTEASLSLYDHEIQNTLRNIISEGFYNWDKPRFITSLTGGFGQLYVNIAKKEVIGNPFYLTPVTEYTLENRLVNQGQHPLIDTGQLREKIEHKVV